MINLLQEKLETVQKLRNYTKEILLLSPKTDFILINSMIENRQKYEETLSLVNKKIDKIKSFDNYCEDSIMIKNINKDISELIKQTIDIDKEIRKKINFELKETKENNNQPEKTSKLNLKA